MKTIKKLILLGVIALVSAACSKSEDPEPNNTSSGGSKVTGSMKATVDGKAWEAKTISFGGPFALITVAGKIDDANVISLQFIETKLEVNKTYTLSIPVKEENLSSNLAITINNAGLFAESGTFRITKYSKGKEIQGEMSAELTNFVDKKASLKNCTFSIKY
ncbi:MAG: hypothetical protein U5M51_08380 [Emticicia sp.]|nr:hypothetical protein [Emticicia sp.]